MLNSEPADNTISLRGNLASPEAQHAGSAFGFILRELEESDYDRGFFELLQQLTEAPKMPREQFKELFARVKHEHSNHLVFVVVDPSQSDKVVGTASLLVEQKFLRNGGRCGHIEDVVSDASVRGKHVGTWLIHHLKCVARAKGCYKVILDCSRKNVPFYQKNGLVEYEVCMRANL